MEVDGDIFLVVGVGRYFFWVGGGVCWFILVVGGWVDIFYG